MRLGLIRAWRYLTVILISRIISLSYGREYRKKLASLFCLKW